MSSECSRLECEADAGVASGVALVDGYREPECLGAEDDPGLFADGGRHDALALLEVP
jgi:hypothetical protein